MQISVTGHELAVCDDLPGLLEVNLAEDALQAQQYILLGEAEDEASDNEGPPAAIARPGPVVIAHMTTRIHGLTVGEAVTRMDIADQLALICRNSSYGGLNVIYRRTDGNIGWMYPGGNPGTDAG